MFLTFCVFSYVFYSIAEDILNHKCFFGNQQNRQASAIYFLSKAANQLDHMAVVALALEEAFEGAYKEVQGMKRYTNQDLQTEQV